MSKVLQNAPREHSAILLTYVKLPFVFKTFVLPIFVWPLKTGFTVLLLFYIKQSVSMKRKYRNPIAKNKPRHRKILQKVRNVYGIYSRFFKMGLCRTN